jgi:hypothetical protein
VLRVLSHKSPRVKCSVIVVQLKASNPIATGVDFPADPLKDRVDTVIHETPVDHVKRELTEQSPNIGVLFVEQNHVLTHFFMSVYHPRSSAKAFLASFGSTLGKTSGWTEPVSQTS